MPPSLNAASSSSKGTRHTICSRTIAKSACALQGTNAGGCPSPRGTYVPLRALRRRGFMFKTAGTAKQSLAEQHTLAAIRERIQGAPAHSYLGDFVLGAIDGCVT